MHVLSVQQKYMRVAAGIMIARVSVYTAVRLVFSFKVYLILCLVQTNNSIKAISEI